MAYCQSVGMDQEWLHKSLSKSGYSAIPNVLSQREDVFYICKQYKFVYEH